MGGEYTRWGPSRIRLDEKVQFAVILETAKRISGIRKALFCPVFWIPGICCANPGMTTPEGGK